MFEKETNGAEGGIFRNHFVGRIPDLLPIGHYESDVVTDSAMLVADNPVLGEILVENTKADPSGPVRT